MPASVATATPASVATATPAIPLKRRMPWRNRRVDLSDLHYPRKPGQKRVRRVFEVLWAFFVLYFGLISGNVVSVFANPGQITPQVIFDALDLGRLYELVKPNLVLAGVVAYVVLAMAVVVPIVLVIAAIVAFLDARHEHEVIAAREKLKAEVERLAPYYKLKPVSQLDPDRGDVQLAKYVASVYLERRVAGSDVEGGADAQVREALRSVLASAAQAGTADTNVPIGILVIGRPTLGKTRCAWEAMRAMAGDATFVTWPHGDAPPFDFTLVAGKPVVLWLDNLQEYANDREAPILSALSGRFAASHLVIVATSRDGDDYDRVESTLKTLTRRLVAITLGDINSGETENLAEQLEARHETVDRDAADGTPGALLLDVAGMIERYLAPAFLPQARAVLKAMKLLRSANTYDFPAARVRGVAHALFDLSDTSGAWQNAVDVLVKQDFVRLGPLNDQDHLNALVPLADVYLERAIPDYPTAGRQLSDDWPALTDALERSLDIDALFNLGYRLAGRGYPSEALATFERALAFDQQNAVAWSNKGAALNYLKRPEEALDAFDRALALDLGDADTWFGKGTSLLVLERLEAALNAFDRALALDPAFAFAWAAKGATLAGLRRYDEALVVSERAVALDPTYDPAWVAKGAALVGLGRYDEALVAYERALALDPNFAIAWLGQAAALVNLKRYDEALAACERALALDPTLAFAWAAKGAALAALERYDEALAALDGAIALRADFADAWKAKAAVLRKLGRKEEAYEAEAQEVEARVKAPGG